MSRCVVFIGPTLPWAEVTALLPAAEILPPVLHGDLLRLDVGPGDAVLIVDGLFMQAASVRHKEILYLLQSGVTVAGSSSMGALRAAELWPFGMRGFGEVFRLYRDGEINGDDEVAIVHGAQEDGHRSCSDPLVNIRIALRDAAAAGAVTDRDARLMLDLAVSMPFRSRSFRALDAAGLASVPAGAIRAFQAWRAAHQTDAKAADARMMLRAAAEGDPQLRPAGTGDQPIRNVHTRMFDTWEHKYHGAQADGGWVANADAANAIRLAHPAFPAAYRRHVLARIAGLEPDHPALTEVALATARATGLEAPGPDADLSNSWVSEHDPASPADDVLIRLLVRAFGASLATAQSRWDLPAQFRTPQGLAWGRDLVLAARKTTGVLFGPGHGWPSRPRPEVIDQAIAELWGCDVSALQTLAWDRGIADLATLRLLAEPFVFHLIFGASLSAALSP